MHAVFLPGMSRNYRFLKTSLIHKQYNSLLGIHICRCSVHFTAFADKWQTCLALPCIIVPSHHDIAYEPTSRIIELLPAVFLQASCKDICLIFPTLLNLLQPNITFIFPAFVIKYQTLPFNFTHTDSSYSLPSGSDHLHTTQTSLFINPLY